MTLVGQKLLDFSIFHHPYTVICQNLLGIRIVGDNKLHKIGNHKPTMHFVNIIHLPSQNPIKVTTVLTLSSRTISKIRWLRDGKSGISSRTSLTQKPGFFSSTFHHYVHQACLLIPGFLYLHQSLSRCYSMAEKPKDDCGFRLDLSTGHGVS